MTIKQMVEIERAAKNAANLAYLHSVMNAHRFSGHLKLVNGQWRAVRKYELHA